MEQRSKFYTVPEAADKFGVDRKTMYRWVTSGKIDSIVTPGGHHRILRSEIDTLLEMNGFSKSVHGKERVILVVDDDESVRETVTHRLVREGFAVETAADGFQAGMKARDMKPDLVILDLKMEGMDGFEVCRAIKTHESLTNTKVIIMTGFDTPENRERAEREGADHFVAKGGSLKGLVKTINDLLAEPECERIPRGLPRG